MTSILVTGPSGFIGQALSDRLETDGYSVVRAVRQGNPLGEFIVGNIGPETEWLHALQGCQAVVHLAARVHVMHDSAMDPLTEFRIVNTDGTLNLARQAAQAGVQRFIFLSSAKVNGEEGTFTEKDPPAPKDAYAISKWEAEQGLHQIMAETGMEVVILRPPLVYGPRVRANFLRLIRLIDRGFPLPLGAVDNHRSLLYLGNLIDAIVACLRHPAAAGKTYLVSDGKAVSTPELIRHLAQALGCRARLWSMPVGVLHFTGRLVGKSKEIDRLLGSLMLDSGAIEYDLDWQPPFSMQNGLTATAAWFREKQNCKLDDEKAV